MILVVQLQGDIVYALYRFVPTTNKDFSDAYIKECLTTFFNTYGMEYPEQFFTIMVNTLEALIGTINNRAKNKEEAFKKMLTDGHVDFYNKEIKYIKTRYL